MKRSTLFVLCLVCFLPLACEDAVMDVDPPIDSIEDSRLDSETQIPFLVTGLQARFASVYGRLSVFAGGLSDELVFDRTVPGATYPSYGELESGDIALGNTSTGNAMLLLAELRLMADTLITRVDRITFADESSKSYALHNAYLYGAIARYFWAAYWGLEEDQGGGVINAGPFIPSAVLYSDAIDQLALAMQFAPTPYDAKVASSLLARIHLQEERYADASAAAAAGLTDGDDSFSALFSTEVANFWHFAAGSGRTQFVADDRYVGYITDDPVEASRVPLTQVTAERYRQNRYPVSESPLPLLVWQEMALIRAEVALRDGQGQTALDLVNSVRQSHGLADLAAITLETLFVEREKELFCMGLRLLDQRRLGVWHLPDGTWKFLPISQRERDSNPNL